MADAHVFVHHALTRLFAHEIPVNRLRERIDDQVLAMPLLRNRLFLGRRAPGIGGGSRKSKQSMRWLQVRSNARLQQARRHLLHRAWRIAAPPQHEVGVGAEADAAISRRDDIWGGFFDHFYECLASP